MTAARALPKGVTLDDLLRHDGDATKHYDVAPCMWHLNPTLPRPDVLSLDLAAAGGWFYLGAKYRAAGEVNAKEARIDRAWTTTIAERLTWSSNRAGVDGQRLLVVVEDTHLGSAARTPLAFAAVTRYGAAVAALCAERGLTMIRVPAQAWQTRVLGKIRRDQGKELSLAAARRRFGSSITSDHVADAALLALFVRGAQ